MLDEFVKDVDSGKFADRHPNNPAAGRVFCSQVGRPGYNYIKEVQKKMQENNIDPKVTENAEENDDISTGRTISVKRMAQLLGIGKTESYWLLNKHFFKTVQIYGHTRIDMESFNQWYASQSEYKKVSERFVVDDPVRQERWRQNFESSDPEYYMIREAAEKYDISKSNIYYWIRSGKVYSVTKDKMTLLPRRSFDLWMKQMRKEKKWHQS